MDSIHQMAALQVKESGSHLSASDGYAQLPEQQSHLSAESLRAKVMSSLAQQGFDVTEAGIQAPDQTNKELLRKLHSVAVEHRIKRGSALRPKEPTLIKRIAAGKEVYPERIVPRLVEVLPDSEDELLFRYAALHWSIPVSSGYGRRIRFLVLDSQNDKLIGIIGLGDPVFGLGARDQWIGWSADQRRHRLRHILDAYVLGAAPPYTELLGGKLVAMLATSEEVRQAFERKYAANTTLISGVQGDARVAMVTTTSALGRSSTYNRVRFHDRLLLVPVGFTTGSGEFHFANGLYGELLAFAATNCKPTAKNGKWGTGFRSRREVIRKALWQLGLPDTLIYHGVQRQVYLAPLAHNVQPFLRGEEDELKYYCQGADSLFEHFKSRWLLPRAERTQAYREYDPRSYLLWHHPDQSSANGSLHDLQ